MIEMTSSQRKMLAQIQKSKKKGIRWDKLYQQYGDVASYQELRALTQQGLLKIVNASGTEMDVPGRIPILQRPASFMPSVRGRRRI